MGALANTKLGEHYTIAKSTGSISMGEIIAFGMAVLLFWGLGKWGPIKAHPGWRFLIALSVVASMCMVD